MPVQQVAERVDVRVLRRVQQVAHVVGDLFRVAGEHGLRLLLQGAGRFRRLLFLVLFVGSCLCGLAGLRHGRRRRLLFPWVGDQDHDGDGDDGDRAPDDRLLLRFGRGRLTMFVLSHCVLLSRLSEA